MAGKRYGEQNLSKVEIGERLKQAREALDPPLTQSDVARALEVSPQAVQKWEAGETSPRAKYYDALETLLGRPRQWLMFGIEGGIGQDQLYDELQDLRERMSQALSCLRAADGAQGADRENLIAAAARVLEST